MNTNKQIKCQPDINISENENYAVHQSAKTKKSIKK